MDHRLGMNISTVLSGAHLCTSVVDPAPMAPSADFAAFAMNLPNFDPSPEPVRPGKCLDPRLTLVSFARFRASRMLMYSVPCSHTMAAPAAPNADLRPVLSAQHARALLSAG